MQTKLCSQEGQPISVKEFLVKKQSPEELKTLLKAYNPVWYFYGDQDSEIYPIDIDTSFRIHGHLQKLECDNGRWRLNYNNGIARNYISRAGRIQASTYSLAQFVEGGIDLHYFLYYPYNIASKFTNAYDHEGDREGAVI